MMSDNITKALHYSHRSAKSLAASFNNDGALKHYLAAIEIVEKNDIEQSEPQILVDLYLELAEIYVLIGDFEKAEAAQKQVLKMSYVRGKKSLQSKCYRRLGDIYRFRGQLDEMLNLLNKALQLSQESGDKEGVYRTFKALGFAYKTSNKLDEALDYLEKALAGARDLKLLSFVAECLNDIATVRIAQHELDLAEKRLTESIEISSEIPRLKSLVISSTLNLGVVFYYRSDFEQALEKFQIASKIAQQIGDLKNLLISKHNIGEILKEFNRDQEALTEFQQSYEIAKEMGNEIERMNNLVLIGYLKTRLGEVEAGEKILSECVEECDRKKYWLYYCDALFYLGKFYATQSKFELSKEAYERSKSKAEEIQANHAIQRCVEELTELGTSKAQTPHSGH